MILDNKSERELKWERGGRNQQSSMTEQWGKPQWQDIVDLLFKKKENGRRWLRFMRKMADSEEELEYLLFEVATEFMFCHTLPQVMEQVKKKEIGWNHPNFEAIRCDFQEQDDFLENPPQVEEGVLECKRCHSRRTFSFSKQTRRSDESATVFIRCSNCDYMYRI